jgi:glycosyltransferase involved in cell wall biosynthesis
MKLVSLVFSFKNEEKNLETLIERLNSTLLKLDNWEYELIFVNDSSDDRSEEILTNLQKSSPIKIINMTRTFGIGPCVLAGFRESKGDVVIYMDADLQDPPEIIPKLIKEYENGAEIVHTVRTKRLGESSFRLLVTKLAYKAINYLSDIPLPVEAGDFKLISRKALNKILEQKEFRPYVRGLSVWVGYKQSFVNYERQPRVEGKSSFPVFSKGPIAEFISGITSYSLKPLYLGIIFGFLSLLFSISLIIYALYIKFEGLAVPGSTSIIITISFFSGILLLTIGIVGIYIARIFEQTKGRDQYVIKNIQNFK